MSRIRLISYDPKAVKSMLAMRGLQANNRNNYKSTEIPDYKLDRGGKPDIIEFPNPNKRGNNGTKSA